MNSLKSEEDIERAVIGSMLLDGTRAIDAFVRAGGRKDWFTPGNARQTAEAILSLHAEGRPVDLLTVAPRSADVPATWREGCVDAVATPAHAGFYIEQLQGLVMLRNAETAIMSAGERLKDMPPENAAAGLAEIVESLHSVCIGHEDEDNTLGDVAGALLDRWTDGNRHANLLPWPLDRITRVMGRLEDEYVWLVSQPSVGKTAFALQWAVALAAAGFPVSFASLESPRDRIAGRLVSYLGRVDTLALKRGEGTAADIEAARAAAERLQTLPLRVTSAGMTLEQLYSWGRAEARRGARLLVLDNTRHIRRHNASVSRVEWMGNLSARLKQLRDDAGVPLLILHHATRPNEHGREDVSWSSDIRRDADCVVFLREDEGRSLPYGGPDAPGRHCVTFDVEKNRDGIRGLRIPLEFVKWRQAFTEWNERNGI